MNSNVNADKRALLRCATTIWLMCALVGANAYADEPGRSETVKFADLNVGTWAGAETLYGRIHAAARRVCDQPSGEMAAIRTCMTKAESQAIAKVNAPLLTSYYQKRTGLHPQELTAKR